MPVYKLHWKYRSLTIDIMKMLKYFCTLFLCFRLYTYFYIIICRYIYTLCVGICIMLSSDMSEDSIQLSKVKSYRCYRCAQTTLEIQVFLEIDIIICVQYIYVLQQNRILLMFLAHKPILCHGIIYFFYSSKSPSSLFAFRNWWYSTQLLLQSANIHLY